MARNTNRQGADFELAVMHALEEHGYNTWRSSGSVGAIDVTAVWDDMANLGTVVNAGQQLLFIQCKVRNALLPPYERRNVLRLSWTAGAVPLVAYKAEEGRLRPIRFRLLTGTGPKEWAPWEPPSYQRSEES